MTDISLVFNPFQMQVWTTQAHTQALSQSAPSPHPTSADETSWSFWGPSPFLCSKKEVVPGSCPADSTLEKTQDTDLDEEPAPRPSAATPGTAHTWVLRATWRPPGQEGWEAEQGWAQLAGTLFICFMY